MSRQRCVEKARTCIALAYAWRIENNDVNAFALLAMARRYIGLAQQARRAV